MKIIVVGAGISGLCLYLFLKKYLSTSLPPDEPLEILIYEKHDDNVPRSGDIIIGGFLAIAPNGVKAIRDLDEELYKDIRSKGTDQGVFNLKSANGWELGKFGAQSYDDPPLKSVAISRQRLWECFRNRVPNDAITQVPVHQVSFDDNSAATLRFGEGVQPQTADLIIGADGVHSATRKAVAKDEGDYSAQYVGLVGVGGLLDPKVKLPAPTPPGSMTLTFGANGFFGYGPTADEEFGWWSTYALSEPPSSNKAIDVEDVKAQLQSRHKDWQDPNIQTFIANVEIDSVYPTWVCPKMPKWSKGNLVLVGDAAHAMQPSSGQGVSQALEDCQVLSILLGHYVGKQDRPKSIEQALTQYERIRRPRVQKCVDRGNRSGDQKRAMGKVKEYMMYGFVWAMTRWPKDSWGAYLYGNNPGDEARAFIEKEKGK